MNKIIKNLICIIIPLVVIYFSVNSKVFSYYTGIGTPYSYFQAQKAKNDAILIIYDSNLAHSLNLFNADSIRLLYGFKYEYGGIEVSEFILDTYNKIIKKELMRRLGRDKLNEYQFKLDSMKKITIPPLLNR